MEQHPIPQQIASYQFKLVGDMTLKQFVQLAGGALISLLLYASPLHPFVKWPLIVVSFLFGVALAFLPIEDRPLSTWIMIFFRAIYSPTYFVWSKAVKPRDYFTPEETTQKPASLRIAEKKEEVQELLKPVVKQTVSTDKLEEKEKSFLTKLTQSFIAPNTTVVISTTPVHRFSAPTGIPVASPPLPQPPSVVGSLTPQAAPQKRPEVTIPGISAVGTGVPSGFVTPPAQKTVQTIPGMSTDSINPFLYQKVGATKDAGSLFSKDVMPPLPSSRPNVVVGQVLDQYGQILEGAILEIKDLDGRPVRALRSNKLGHFMIATPLISGNYSITAEKEGYEFEPSNLKVEDTVIPPIAIWATKGGTKKIEPEPVKTNPNQDFLKEYNI